MDKDRVLVVARSAGKSNLRLGMSNEFCFINRMNGLLFKEIAYNLQEFLLDIYDEDICEEDMFFCWKYDNKGKPDIVIRRQRGGKLRFVSIKMGHRNSVHTELLENFVEFLRGNGVEDFYLDLLREYHYKDGSIDGSGFIRLSASEYQSLNCRKVRMLNDRFCNSDLIVKLFDRFLFKGTGNGDFVDYIINGSPDNFLFINRESIYILCLDHIRDFSKSLHFSFLTLQNKNANLHFKASGERDRKYIQIRWYNMEDFIIESMNRHCNR